MSEAGFMEICPKVVEIFQSGKNNTAVPIESHSYVQTYILFHVFLSYKELLVDVTPL